MGIFSFGKKDEAPARGGSRSGSRGASNRRSNEGRVERRSRRPDRSGDAEAMLLDPTLPEKQRARRRLVGAIALVIAAVVVLPMILDTHPKPVTDDIAIDIPSRPATKAPSRDDANGTLASTAPDNPDDPATANTTAAASGVAPAKTAQAPAAAQKSPSSVQTQSTQLAQATKPAAPAKPQPSAQKPSSVANNATPREAVPADTDVQPASSAQDAGTPSAPPGARFALQLGSFADDASARKWETKLKAAGVPAYTEHRTEPDGKTRTLLRAGPFPDRASASEAIAKVRGAGLGTGAGGGRAE